MTAAVAAPGATAGAAVALRPARRSEAETLTMLHVAIWRETYRELAPPETVATLDVERRLGRWREMLADPERIVLVAEAAGGLAGFGVAGPPSDPVFGARGEVKLLYVAAGFARQGLGRRLLAALAGGLLARGYGGLALGVVVGNDPAIAFYEALGGRRLTAYRDRGPLWRSDNLAYVWDDLPALAASAPARAAPSPSHGLTAAGPSLSPEGRGAG
ncbi:Ribosomal protein S18 acetylase RimI [Tistlia consotensis]|uniref:Ribosomal protein S18 acetylase RimI n=1 Tax=Tistlia consotensis USBA 355 TaxID=560819 RepID=A0A1Y6BLR7_9PROT|nr:GNAT family N-acetyltransferase [Tistlia consotensis]SMF16121.1 Ribosomal protein S18 acetylase RimI [Tistlia consotensis USBA 355]SNR41395.1 Ribosomal protein S18 acetylase RimI [Tistlia consotensis]